jgi:putative ABC transport system permease protein
VLKTLGFTDGLILMLVLLESGTIAIVGGGLGLLISWSFITAVGDPTGGMLPIFHFPPRDLILGAALVLALGIGTGLLPAWQASRMKIVDALRRT